MIFGGIQKNSLIDYPGKISCVLFALGCNFSCPYCHNPKLVKGRVPGADIFNEDKAFALLEKRAGFLDGVVISGGEPTLHPDLESVCRRIKQLGYPLKLDTNGSRPKVLSRLIDAGLLDYIAMDVKTDPARYAPPIWEKGRPETIVESIKRVMKSGLPYEFKTTCVRPLVDRDIIETICRLIHGAERYALQQFQNTGVLDPTFFETHTEQYDLKDLERFRKIAAPWVGECFVR